MIDSFLAWFVVIAPTLFALGIELISEEIRKSRTWRIAVLSFGLLLSGLTWWQQSRERSASANDRQEAVQQTASKVSAEVSKTLTAQYEDIVADLNIRNADQKNQIDQLKLQLGHKVDVFSSSTSSNFSALRRDVEEALKTAKLISTTSTLKVKALQLAKRIDDFVLVYTREQISLQNASEEEQRRLWDKEQNDWDRNFQSEVNEVTRELKQRGLMDNPDNVGNSGNGCGFRPKLPSDTLLPRRVCVSSIVAAAEKIN